MRFLSLKPSMYQSSYSRLPLHESAGRQEFLKDKNTLAQTYASRNMRKLQNRRKSSVSLYNLNKYGSSKRRLASSPLRLVFSKALYSADKNSSTLATSNAEPLLLAALKSRMKLRQLQDLTLHAQRRLLPSEQILPP